ncbi:MAG: DNA replication/repair protein RecF [Pseudomonadota bacterium]
MRDAATATYLDEDFASGSATPIRRLKLNDFRSYSSTDIAFDGRPVAIAGPNGSGKTNILEAISLFGPGRGLRSARLQELPRVDGHGGWALSMRLGAGLQERSLGVGAHASKPERRVCRLDDQAASGPGAFTDILRFLWLTPAQDRLFMESAGERRKFIDRMALAQDSAHGRAASAYEKAMRQRQRLLETPPYDDDWLSALEIQMAESGVAVAAARIETVERLSAAAPSSDDAMFPAADMALDGDIERALSDRDAASVEEEFASTLRERRRLDAEAGRSLYGPHRSDLLVFHRQKMQAARLCSTGEQKALLIGLVLANARTLCAETVFARPPLILLLDEIAAHLDPSRRAALFDIVGELGFQAFMTGTDDALFSAWGGRAQYFETGASGLAEKTL